MRIGLLGGTFDPIHNAHIQIAEAAAAQCKLQRVLLVPAANPPHRARGPFASYSDRLRMIEIACDGRTLLETSTLDDTSQKSYSIQTIERLRSTLSDADEIYFLIGADAFAELRSWHRWRDVARGVTFAVVDRPGATYQIPEGTRIHAVTGLNLPVSSSEIRAQLAQGNPNVDVPSEVLDYIRKNHLYGA